MSRLLLEFVSSAKIYRVCEYKALVIRFLCGVSLSDKSERSIELIKSYIDVKSPRKNVVCEGFRCFVSSFIFESESVPVGRRIVD